MATEKQIAANRLNAQKSTGPRTPEGKAKSRLNALRDGITGQIITLADEDRAIFEQLKSDFIADLKPATTLERKLAHAVAWDTWRLDRLKAVEENIYALGTAEAETIAEAENPGATLDDLDVAFAGARTFLTESRRFDVMSLYEQRMTRNLHRNLDKLHELQAERKRNYEHDKKEEVRLARFNEVCEIPIQTATTPSKNGFIFSNQEIAVAAVRERQLETVTAFLDRTPAGIKYGDMHKGLEDSMLLPVECQRPIPDNIRNKIHGVSTGSLVARRLSHPEEFNIRSRSVRH